MQLGTPLSSEIGLVVILNSKFVNDNSETTSRWSLNFDLKKIKSLRL